MKSMLLAKSFAISNRNREIKMRWQEYTEKLYKKCLNDLDNHDGVITHQDPDILECEVKWALRTPAELFQILKDNAL